MRVERFGSGVSGALEFNGVRISCKPMAGAGAERQPLCFFGKAPDRRKFRFQLYTLIPRLEGRPRQPQEEADDSKRDHNFQQGVTLEISRRFDG